MNIQMMKNVLVTLWQFRQHDAWTPQHLEAYQAEQLNRGGRGSTSAILQPTRR